MSASPFGAGPTLPSNKAEDPSPPIEQSKKQSESPAVRPESKNTQKEEKARVEDAKEDRPLQVSPKKKEGGATGPTPQGTPQPLPKAAAMKPAESNSEDRQAGFFNMITGFLGFLNLRKQAYTGKPASAIYYDEKKGRYVIAGEEESDDDEPPPPPPGARRGGG